MMRLYFAHQTSDFNTPFEESVVRSLELLGYSPVNPNTPENQAGYQARGWEFSKELRAGCDACAFLRFPDGMIGHGVANEVRGFLKDGKPVFEIIPDDCSGLHTLKAIAELPAADVLPMKTTQEATAYFKAQPLGGRTGAGAVS